MWMARNSYGIRLTDDLRAYTNGLSNGVRKFSGRRVNNLAVDLVCPASVVFQSSSYFCKVLVERDRVRFAC